MTDTRVERITARLADAFRAEDLVVRDDSRHHVGHEGAKDGRGHFHVRIVADAFDGKAVLARHRAVFAAVGDLMTTDIHALSIEALTPAEAGQTRKEDR